LVFYDDFTGNSLSPAWTVISRHGEYAQGETECNVPEMVSVANGTLTITTEPTPNPDPQMLGTCEDFNVPVPPSTTGTVRHTPSSWPYVTGDVQWTSLNFTYGRIEIRAKFPPSSTNLWPATWLLESNCQLTNIYTADTGYSTCPDINTSGYTEIDMTECYNSGGWCQFHVANPTFSLGGGCEAAYPVDANYHVFTTVWTSTSIKQYMDGSLMATCNQKLSNPMFLLIQTQTGGVGGTPSNSRLPAQFMIDYVLVTQP
jgi:beta-glucanase (GH16 family)